MTESAERSPSKSGSLDFGDFDNPTNPYRCAAAPTTPLSNNMPDLSQVRTQGTTITLSPEMFEHMYLSPPNKVSGKLRSTLGNPTPIGLGGFLMAHSSLVFAALGWRGDGHAGAATVGVFFFSGGMIVEIAMVLELILGNTFPATFFGVFGAYFLAYGATLVPFYNAAGAFDPTDPVKGLEATGYLSGIAFWNLMMAIFTLFCTICSLRTNIVFFLAFLFLTNNLTLIASSQWAAAEGNLGYSHTLQVAAGANGFVVLIFGWYLLLSLMFSTVDFPISLPLGDLSTVIKSGSSLRKKKNNVDLEKNE